MLFSNQYNCHKNNDIESRLKSQIEMRKPGNDNSKSMCNFGIKTRECYNIDFTNKFEIEIKTRNYNTDSCTYTNLFKSDSLNNPIIFNKFSTAINSASDEEKARNVPFSNPTGKNRVFSSPDTIKNSLYALLDKYGNSFAKSDVDVESNILDYYTITTPLQLAIVNKKIIAVKIILNYLAYDLTNADINYLAIATEVSTNPADTEIMKELLLCKGSDPNVRGGTQSQLPLYYAIINKNLESIDLLLHAGINFELCLDNNLTFIEFCIYNKYPDIITLSLLKNQNMILYEADLKAIFKFGSSDIIKSVLSAGIISLEINYDLNKLFTELTNRPDIDIQILVLMQNLIDSDQFNQHFNTILNTAITNSDIGTVQYLLQNNYVDLTISDVSGHSALTTALLVGSNEINHMIAYYINTNCTPDIKTKIINHKTSSDQTPLLIIAEKDNTDLFKLFHKLFESDLELDPKSNFKILYYAIKNSNSEIFDIVIKLIDINDVDSSGMTLAMHAINLKKIDIAKKIINLEKFNVHVADALGRNILTYLLEHKYGCVSGFGASSKSSFSSSLSPINSFDSSITVAGYEPITLPYLSTDLATLASLL